MSISNRKPGERREPVAEPLKRSVAGCLRAIARRAEVEVTYATDRPALTGDKARLPEPPRKLTAAVPPGFERVAANRSWVLYERCQANANATG